MPYLTRYCKVEPLKKQSVVRSTDVICYLWKWFIILSIIEVRSFKTGQLWDEYPYYLSSNKMSLNDTACRIKI
jgi:hypothetical protein